MSDPSEALHVETAGNGPPLVLLHGWAMHSGIWGPLVGRLARRFRVHAVDLPGHGHSPLAGSFTLEGASTAVATSIPFDAGPLTVFGWSLGGLIARFRSRMRELPWRLLDSLTAIQPVIVGSNTAALELAAALWARGFWVPAIRPPTVPKGTARLRISLCAAHSTEDVDALVDALAELVR